MASWWVVCLRWCRPWSLWAVVSGDGTHHYHHHRRLGQCERDAADVAAAPRRPPMVWRQHDDGPTTAQPRNDGQDDGASRSRNDRTATAQQRHESAVRRRRDEHHDRDYDRDHGHEAAGDEAAAEGRAVGGDGNGEGAAGMAMVPREW
ncbi:hypothetical protein EDB84DRAFT_1436643 [Lactarius hengduanensis]|nr:hypothetical protein EDB84DRAFT_1436643 [Lactarius hengduanensis]